MLYGTKIVVYSIDAESSDYETRYLVRYYKRKTKRNFNIIIRRQIIRKKKKKRKQWNINFISPPSFFLLLILILITTTRPGETLPPRHGLYLRLTTTETSDGDNAVNFRSVYLKFFVCLYVDIVLFILDWLYKQRVTVKKEDQLLYYRLQPMLLQLK